LPVTKTSGRRTSYENEVLEVYFHEAPVLTVRSVGSSFDAGITRLDALSAPPPTMESR
jgi:hypothetical protein